MSTRSLVIDSDTGHVCIGGNPSASSNALLRVNGIISCLNVQESSSRRFKRDIRPLSAALDTLSRLQGVSYRWDAEHGGDRDIGFIAEDVAKVVPDIVTMEPGGEHAIGMQYGKLNALAVEAVKELKTMVEAKDARIAAQQQQIDALAADLKALRESISHDRSSP